MSDKPSGPVASYATLVRGRVYVFKNVFYYNGERKEVDDLTADALEALSERIADGDGDEYEKFFFEIERGVPKAEVVETERRQAVVRGQKTSAVRGRIKPRRTA